MDAYTASHSFNGRKVKILGFIVLAIAILLIGVFAIRPILILVGYTSLLGFSLFKGNRTIGTIIVLCALAIIWGFIGIAIANFIKLDKQASETNRNINCYNAASKSVVYIPFLNAGFDNQRINRIVYQDLNHGAILDRDAGLVFLLVDHLKELESSKIRELVEGSFADRINYLEQKCLSR